MSLNIKKKKELPKYYLGGEMPSSGQQKAAKKANRNEETGKMVTDTLSAIGPWGAAIAAGSKASDKMFGSKNGSYSGANEMLHSSFSITKGVGNSLDNLDAIFKGNGKQAVSGLLDQATFGILGKNIADEEAKKEAQYQQFNTVRQAAMNTQLANNQARLPQVSAPLYGRKGLKLIKRPKY